MSKAGVEILSWEIGEHFWAYLPSGVLFNQFREE